METKQSIIAMESDQTLSAGEWTNLGRINHKIGDGFYALTKDKLCMKEEELVPVKLFLAQHSDSIKWSDLSEKKAYINTFLIEESSRETAFHKIDFNKDPIWVDGKRVWVGADAGDNVELDFLHKGCGGEVRSSYDGDAGKHFEYCAKCDADDDELERDQTATI